MSKVLGILRESLLAWSFGDGPPVEVLTVVNSISASIFGVLTATIGIAALPLYTELKIRRNSEEAKLFLVNLVNILLLGAALLVVLCWLAAEPLISLFGPGFIGDSEKFGMAVQMLRVVIFSAYFQIGSGIFAAYLQSERRMAQIVLMNASVNIGSIGGIFLAQRLQQPIWLAYGLLVGAILPCMLLYAMSRRYGFRWRPYVNVKDPLLRRVMVLMLPVWAGQILGMINTMVDKSVATLLFEGAASLLHFAQTLLGSVQSLFVPTVLMFVMPYFAESAVHSHRKLIEAFTKAMRFCLLIVVPLTLGTMAVADSAVEVIYGRGAFSVEAIQLTSLAMILYAPGHFIFSVVNDVTQRVFVVLQDTVTPFVTGAVGVVVNIVLNLLLSHYLGIGGLALATTLASLTTALLRIVLMRRKVGEIGGASLLRAGIWTLGASLIMLLPVFAIRIWLFPYVVRFWQRLLLLIAQAGSGALLYFLIIMRSGIPEVDEILSVIRSRLPERFSRSP